MKKNDNFLIKNYFEKFAGKYFETEPISATELAVVIPVFNEPNFDKTIFSVLKNNTNFKTDIYVIVNQTDETPVRIKQTNYSTISFIKEIVVPENFRIIPHLVTFNTGKGGVGAARKIGFDTALWHFWKINKPQAPIISLDADTLVKENYLFEIKKFFDDYPKIKGANICFFHPTNTDESVSKAIILYELYLRYFSEALKYTRFPYPYITIGSAFAVRGHAYAAVGGMPQNMAGEDFYFLQKIFHYGKYGEIKKTAVFPSPRITDRVPFGTGVAVKQITENNFVLKTYAFEAFEILKNFFSTFDTLYNNVSIFPKEPLKTYLLKNNFERKILNARKNSASPKNFKKRMFSIFDRLEIIKFLNFSHDNFYHKQDLINECKKLATQLKINVKINNPYSFLTSFRKLQC